MTLKIPDYINKIAPYVAGKPIAEVEREYGIQNSVKLASNENPLGPSPKAMAAIVAAAANVHRYPDEPSYDLINRLAAQLKVQPEQVIIGNGSDEILGFLSRALLRPGDEVILPSPSFLMYTIVTQTAGALQVTVPLKDMGIDLQGVLAAVTPRTRLVFICNPNNPTGSVVHHDEFSAFLDALPSDIVVVVDEAYAEFVRDPLCAKGLSFIDHDTPVVTLRTFSKAYGLAGLRVGYGVMPVEVAAVLNKVRMPFNVNALAHSAALAALDDTAFLNRTVDLTHQSLDLFYSELGKRQIRYFPTQANFFLIDVGQDAHRFFKAMLRQGVIVRSMAGYGYPEYIRINIGLPEENRKFLAALDIVLGSESETKLPPLLITIDGPAGAGKTTVSRTLARRLGYRYIDTGALYRGIALAVDSAGIESDDDPALETLCDQIDLDFQPRGSDLRLMLNGKDVSDDIRSPRITMLASAVSARPVVRRFLLDIQRTLGAAGKAVFEGRDMGTVVFPQADVKFFLDADPNIRARRRYEELQRKQGPRPTFDAVAQEMVQRDKNDSSRDLAPLKPASDAHRINSTTMSVDEVVGAMLAHIRSVR